MASKGHHADPIHIFLIVWCAIEIFLFGGQVYGWPSLVYILKQDGYYEDLCEIIRNDTDYSAATTPLPSTTTVPTLPPNVTGAPPPIGAEALGAGGMASLVIKEINGTIVEMDCKEQDFVFQQIFTIATVFTGATLVLNGILFDKVGTLICRIICILGCVGSYLCLAFASPGIEGILYPTITIMEATGFLIMLTNLGIGSLVPKISSTILAFYHGCFDASACILVIVKTVYQSGVMLNASYILMASAFSIIVIPSTFFFLPRFKIPSPAPKHYRTRTLRALSHICGEAGRVPKSEARDEEENMIKAEGIALPKKRIRRKRQRAVSEGESSKTAPLALDDVFPLGRSDPTIDKLREGRKMRSKSERKYSLPSGRSGSRYGSRRLSAIITGAPIASAESLSSLYHFADSKEVAKIIRSVASLPSHIESDEEYGSDQIEDKDKNLSTEDTKKVVTDEKITPFKDILKSPLFISDLIWISLHRFRNWIFLGLFNVWITRMADNDDSLVSQYTSAFQTMQFFGIFLAPLSGCLMDRRKKHETNENIGKIEACFLSFLLDSIVGLLLSIGACIPVIEVQYVTCFLHVVHRAFLYGPNSAFMAKVFPMQHFGKLFGTYMTVSALFSLIQIPLFVVVKGPLNNDPFILNVVLVVLMVFTFGHPFYVFWYCKKLRREDAKKKLDVNGTDQKNIENVMDDNTSI